MNTTTTTFTRKVAKNRGNCRVWIEGKKLLDAGISNGDIFTCTFSVDKVILDFANLTNDTRKVSGNPSRPIIDINSSKLNSILSGDTHYIVTVGNQRLTITSAAVVPVIEPEQVKYITCKDSPDAERILNRHFNMMANHNS